MWILPLRFTRHTNKMSLSAEKISSVRGDTFHFWSFLQGLPVCGEDVTVDMFKWRVSPWVQIRLTDGVSSSLCMALKFMFLKKKTQYFLQRSFLGSSPACALSVVVWAVPRAPSSSNTDREPISAALAMPCSGPLALPSLCLDQSWQKSHCLQVIVLWPSFHRGISSWDLASGAASLSELDFSPCYECLHFWWFHKSAEHPSATAEYRLGKKSLLVTPVMFPRVFFCAPCGMSGEQ